MIYSLFYGHNSFEFALDSILGQQLLLSVYIVVLYQFAITCIENFADKVEA